ncbi:MAG TPA: hypothetical protein VL133_15855 [Devosia sp.]|nr:hypothetical protein [Devosia sp.]
MPKYILGYHGGGMPSTPEEGAKVTAAWGKWIGDLGSAMVDAGNPVGASKTVAANGSISDGGGANPLTGYSVIEAPNLDAAVKLVKNCPQLAAGGSVQVAETFNVM